MPRLRHPALGRLARPLAATAAIALLLAGGCAYLDRPRVAVLEPTTVRPDATPTQLAAARAQGQPPAAGAIFSDGAYRGLFEDRRARRVGDVITINIQERNTARSSQNSSLERSGALEARVSAIPLLPANNFTAARATASGKSSNTFEGKGETGSDAAFSGTIAVTVIDVLANGNLVVSGEKQVGINQNVETLRFSGVVNPASVLPGNQVSSNQVADARLEVRGRGDIDRAQTTGWLARFFLSFLPI